MQAEKIDFVKVGQRIQLARKNQNLTQSEVCEKIGWTSKHLSAVEQGTSRPSFELIVSLTKVLRVNMDYFFMDAPQLNPSHAVDVEMSRRADRMTTATKMACLNIMDQLLIVQDAATEN